MNTQIAISSNTLQVSHIKRMISAYLSDSDISPTSRRNYEKSLSYFFKYTSDNKINLQTISRSDIIAYKTYLSERYSVSTINAYLSALKSFFAYLESEKIYPNICSSIKGIKQKKGFKKDCLTTDQARSILGTLESDSEESARNTAIFQLMITTGLRTIELERANIGDLKVENGSLVLYVQGKGRQDKDDFVVIPDSLFGSLQKYLSYRGEVSPTDPLFVSVDNRTDGNRLTTRSIRRIVKNIMVDNGIEDDRLTAHSLRHTAITLALIGGASLQSVQAMARHSNINTTMIYSHNLDRLQSSAESVVNSILCPKSIINGH